MPPSSDSASSSRLLSSDSPSPLYELRERVDVASGHRLLRSAAMADLKLSDATTWTAIRDSIALATSLGGHLPVQYYKTADQEGLGRMKSRVMTTGFNTCIPFVRMKREARAHLASAYYRDVDIVNCHPSILAQRLEIDSIPCPLLNDYVDRRDECINEVMQACRVSRDIAKNLFIRLLFLGSIEGWHRDNPGANIDALPPWVSGLKEELHGCTKQLVRQPEFDEIKAAVKRRAAPDRDLAVGHGVGSVASIVAFYLQTKECECICALVEAIQADDLSVGGIIYDGVLVEATDDTDDQFAARMKRWMHTLKRKHGFTIALACKPFVLDPTWMSEEDQEDRDDKWTWMNDDMMMSYEDMKATWERRTFKIVKGGCYIREERDSSHTVLSERMLVESYKHLQYAVVFEPNAKGIVKVSKHTFITRWCSDTSIRAFKEMVLAPPPMFVPECAYNLWNGFAVQRYDPGDRVVDTNSEAVRAYIGLLDAICSHDAAVLRYLLNWIAQIFQQPSVKTGIALLLKGEEGVGKNRVTDLLRAMLGPKECFLQTSSPSSTLYGRFTRLREGKLLIVINESSGSDNFAANDIIKDMITCDEFVSEGKGTNAYTVACFARFIFTTNNDNCLKINPDSRRYFVIEASSELKGNQDYFKRISAHIDDLHSRYEFYRLLLDRDISGVEWANDRPVTDGLLQMISLNMPMEHEFIKEMVVHAFNQKQGDVADESIITRLDSLHRRFLDFLLSRDKRIDGLTAKKFGIRLTKLVWTETNITGFRSITKSRTEQGMVYTFKIKSLADEMVQKKWASKDDFIDRTLVQQYAFTDDTEQATDGH